MIQIADKHDCCGCAACVSVCKHGALVMKPDDMGFVYPVLDREKCVNCGLCESVCQFNPNYNKTENLVTPLAYGVRHKSEEERRTSRSGAIFIALSDWVISHGGVVYGAGYDGHFVVTHKRATTRKERNLFKGSKYVQSNTDGIYRQVKEDLTANRIVLFSGTPCQIAAVKSFIGDKLRERLYLLDIVCHGVPSPKIWADYLAWIESKKKCNILDVDFRNKRLFGWLAHHETFQTNKGAIVDKDLYSRLFCQNIMLRPSCANCHFCNINRPSDITIGDYWGFERVNPNANPDDLGVSLVLVNTPKGERWMQEIKEDIVSFSTNIDNILQPNLQQPTVFDARSKEFEADYIEHGFGFVAHKYVKYGIVDYIRQLKVRLKNACLTKV